MGENRIKQLRRTEIHFSSLWSPTAMKQTIFNEVDTMCYDQAPVPRVRVSVGLYL